MVQHSPNSPHHTHIDKAQSELKSLLKQAGIVFCCFVAMLILTGGNPPGWMLPITFLVAGGFVFWAESKREMPSDRSEASTDFVSDSIDVVVEISVSETLRSLAQSPPVEYLKSGRIKAWNRWREQNPHLSRAHLNFANLSGASLWRANLSGADLSGADLSGADLSGADLSDAHLNFANLSGASLWRADLSDADLSGADLSGANLSGAIVENAQFGTGIGLSEAEKPDLKRRGAKFDDASNDREFVFKR